MSGFLETLLCLSLSGAVLGCMLLLIQRLAKKRLPSAFYYYAWLAVLLRFILPLPGLVPLSGGQAEAAELSWTARAYAGTDSAAEPEAAPEPEPSGETALTAASAGTALSAPEAAGETTLENAPADSGTARRNSSFPARARILLTSSGFWTGVWALGAFLYAARYIAGYCRFSRRLRRLLLSPRWTDREIYYAFPLKRRPRLARCRSVSTPMLLGLVRPVIVLPDRDYTPQTLKNILDHELTHYRRGDILFKWFAVLVFAAHWFNPLTRLFRRQLDRACELSCDERLLRRMTAQEKQDYGEMLLTLAAGRSLPYSTVATTFATEKRTLKERLVQIMTYKKQGKKGLILAIAAILLLCACGAVMGPGTAGSSGADAAPESAPVAYTDSSRQSSVYVDTVDELLAAIAPDTAIFLTGDTYDLSQAADYGAEPDGGWYAWEPEYDGYELVVTGVENLSITGRTDGETTISAGPRYADVLTFRDCQGVALFDLTVGHTEEPSMCSGGVIYLENASDIQLERCRLYGCGILGVTAVNCSRVLARETEIYECSNGAVSANACYDICLEDCSIHDCVGAFGLFNFSGCYGAAVVNCRVYNNTSEWYLLRSAYSQEVYFLGTAVEGNSFSEYFGAQRYSPVVDGCAFTDNKSVTPSYYDPLEDPVPPVSPDGTELTDHALEAMTLAQAVYDGPRTAAVPELEKTVTADGMTEVNVSTVDELLAAIAPNTTVYLNPGEYNLATASSYGAYGGQYYAWAQRADGLGLVISGVENFHLTADNPDETRILAESRYADVITFSECENISLTGLTAGHTQGPSPCGGGVLRFVDSRDVTVERCGLFGCGILGVNASGCENLLVTDTEIYECSDGAVWLISCRDAAFDGCDIHDCGKPLFVARDCENVTCDGEDISLTGLTDGQYPAAA